jgi:hypothetical protein
MCLRINKHKSWVNKHEELRKIGYIVPNAPKSVKRKGTLAISSRVNTSKYSTLSKEKKMKI